MWAIVTGGGSGLGLAIATQLSVEGYNIVIVGRNQAKLDSAARAILEACGACDAQSASAPVVRVETLSLDLSAADAPETLYNWTCDHDIKVDILVNNAGAYAYKPVCELSREQMAGIVDLNVASLASMCRVFGADMASRSADGVRRYILNIASYSVYMPIEGFAMYAGTKAFVRTFNRCFAKEMRHHNVKVTAVAPAGIDTGLMHLRPGIQKIARAAGFLVSPRIIARKSLRALRCPGIHYWIPGWHNALFIPFLWLFQPIFKKVL